jgi:flagellar L-ring protein precursor FlgH
MKGRAIAILIAAVIGLFVSPTVAADLYGHDIWPSLATDRTAHRVGDALTVVVYENASAINSANNESSRSTALGGRLNAGNNFNESAALALNGSSDDTASTGRSGGMVAQLSVVVDQILPNGDLHVSGSQLLNINGEKTQIRVAGRVRPSDISSGNFVLSTRLADAAIDYDGQGFVSRSAAPGILTRIFNWLGLP